MWKYCRQVFIVRNSNQWDQTIVVHCGEKQLVNKQERAHKEQIQRKLTVSFENQCFADYFYSHSVTSSLVWVSVCEWPTSNQIRIIYFWSGLKATPWIGPQMPPSVSQQIPVSFSVYDNSWFSNTLSCALRGKIYACLFYDMTAVAKLTHPHLYKATGCHCCWASDCLRP